MARTDSIQSELQARVDDFVADLSDLIRQAALEAVHDALGDSAGGSTGTRRKRTTKRGTPKKRATKKRTTKAGRGGKRRAKRSGASVEKVMAQVVKALEAEANQGVEQLAATLGVHSADVKQPVAMLLENGTVKRKGKARGTRYSLK